MKTRKFSASEALKFLGINPPKIKKGMTQAQVNAMVEEWKQTTLREHLRQRRKETHPDRPEGDEELFKNLTIAYEEVVEHLEIRIPGQPRKPSFEDDLFTKFNHFGSGNPFNTQKARQAEASKRQAEAEAEARYKKKRAGQARHKNKQQEHFVRRKNCRSCNALRMPSQADHCHECGLAYEREKPPLRCMLCKSPRQPATAKFCWQCGKDYRFLTDVEKVMFGQGMTWHVIKKIRDSGQLNIWEKEYPINPEAVVAEIKSFI